MTSKLYHDEEPEMPCNQVIPEAFSENVVPIDLTQLTPDEARLIIADNSDNVLSELIRYARGNGGK